MEASRLMTPYIMKDESQLDQSGALSTLAGRAMRKVSPRTVPFCSSRVGFLKSRRRSVVIDDSFYQGNRVLDPAHERTGLRYRI